MNITYKGTIHDVSTEEKFFDVTWALAGLLPDKCRRSESSDSPRQSIGTKRREVSFSELSVSRSLRWSWKPGDGYYINSVHYNDRSGITHEAVAKLQELANLAASSCLYGPIWLEAGSE